MLPIVLVLFVATSAFGAPSVLMKQGPITSVAQAYDPGFGVTGGLISNMMELTDQAERNIYMLTVEQILQDMGNQQDAEAQALALSQTIAYLGEVAYGITGDACAAASALSANNGGLNFLNEIRNYIDVIADVAVNPRSYSYSSGPRGNCAGAGRTYDFESAWDVVLNQVSSYSLPLINEEYCAVKRLFQAFSARSNNVAAAITAASQPAVVAAVQRNLVPITNFFRAVNSGNAYAYAAAAKNFQ